MTTSDDMTPRRPDENEPLEELLGDALDHVDETVARITDADVNEHLLRVLSQSGYAGQLPGRWQPHHHIGLDCPLDAALEPEYQEMANLAATVRANARLSRESLRQAQETVDAAHQEAEQIVGAARDKADEALEQAAQMVRNARVQADQIIDTAHREAKRIITVAQDSYPRQALSRHVLEIDFGRGGMTAHSVALNKEAGQPHCIDISLPSGGYLDQSGESTADESVISYLIRLAEYAADDLSEITLGHSYSYRMLATELIGLISGGQGQPRLSIDAGEPVRALPAAIDVDSGRTAFPQAFPVTCPDDQEMPALGGYGIPGGDIGSAATRWTSVGPDGSADYGFLAGSVTPQITLPMSATPPAKAWHAPPADGQICAMIAVDIAGFSAPRRDDETRRIVRASLYRCLQQAFDRSGIPWADCFHEDRGDGALVVVPPAIACKGIIDPLPERLGSLIRQHNHVSGQPAGIQLRLAAHIGPVEHDGHGFVGSDVNLLFRMLEARPLRRALADSQAELALMVSDYMYQSLVSRTSAAASRDAFRRVRFQVKRTRTGGWTYLPDREAIPAVPDAGAGELHPPDRKSGRPWTTSTRLAGGGYGAIWKIRCDPAENAAAKGASQLAGDR